MVWSLALGHSHPGMTLSFAEIRLFDSLLAKGQSLMYLQAPGPEQRESNKARKSEKEE